jgi:hypothetical protein
MSQRNKNNSIVFLTTFSVYLGLVLVGGAVSPILAQAALTRNFNIQDEIEVKDDLDNKPNENDLFASSIVKLIEELDKLSREGKFDWQLKNEIQIEDFELCDPKETTVLASWVSDGSINNRVDYEIGKTSFKIAEKLLTRITELKIGGRYDRTIDYKFSFNGKSLTIQAKVKFDNEKNTQIFANEFASYLTQPTHSSNPTKEKIIAEKRKASIENNQVFIVTRLPRGSLDELLKQNVKAKE